MEKIDMDYDELEKFTINFSRYANHEVAPLSLLFVVKFALNASELRKRRTRHQQNKIL